MGMKRSQALAFSAALAVSSASLAADDDPITAARFGISIDGVQASAKAIEGGGIATATAKASSTPLQITITIKQKIIEKDEPPVFVLESARLTLDATDAKTLTTTIAKGASQPLELN